MWSPHVLVCVLFSFLISEATGQDEPCLCLEQFGTEELFNPTFMKPAPGDDERIFVGEQIGYIWIYDRDGNRNPEPFLNITDRMEFGDFLGEGLLGLAFHPDFQNNRKFYIDSMEWFLNPQCYRISEFTTSLENPDVADMDSERIILDIIDPDEPYIGHQGGDIFFGIDDMFYIPVGDGYHRSANGQDMSKHLGKILRIDVNTGDDDVPYLVPDDNPFVNEPEYLPEIYALGWRQPYKCAVDPGDSETGEHRGRVLCADVGQWTCEEVDILQAGGNYAWDVKECIYCYPPGPDPQECIDDPVVTPGEEVLPIYYYTEWGPGGQSITGGYIYRGSEIPAYYGDYFWTDWAVKFQAGLNRLRENEDETWSNAHIPLCDAEACGEGLESEHAPFAFSFGQDPDLEMYILESDNTVPNQGGGVIFKLVDPQSKKRGQ